ncbi:MAG: sugar phosphate isomerase/epimerase, partial [Bacteroidales bacterium]|nr:sugar phosphate isomerase/epimerase [Bacteroidales bacterium]
MKKYISRREFIQTGFGAGAALALMGKISLPPAPPSRGMKLGFVTYQWGRDWDLPT